MEDSSIDDNDINNIEKLVDHCRWMLNNGIMNDMIKNQLFMYGSIVHKQVSALDLSIDMEKKCVNYEIYVSQKIISKIEKFNKLREDSSIFGLWRFKRFLRKEGNLDFQNILNSFVGDYCGSTWSATVSVINFSNYTEGYDGDNEEEEIRYDINTDTESNG